jgi:phosphinothricin acetyltransferase
MDINCKSGISVITSRERVRLSHTDYGLSTTECAIVFKQEYVGRGLGHFLLQHLIQVLRDSGFRVVIACISATNQTSARFFGREGFSRTGYLPGIGSKNGQTLDLEIWQLDLRAGVSYGFHETHE